jgi:hypothetical protein
MYQEEILKAIQEQTKAIERQTDAIDRLCAALAIPTAGRRPVERGIPTNRTKEQIKADNKRFLQEARETKR